MILRHRCIQLHGWGGVETPNMPDTQGPSLDSDLVALYKVEKQIFFMFPKWF